MYLLHCIIPYAIQVCKVEISLLKRRTYLFAITSIVHKRMSLILSRQLILFFPCFENQCYKDIRSLQQITAKFSAKSYCI